MELRELTELLNRKLNENYGTKINKTELVKETVEKLNYRIENGIV